jgi:hypothetical protein
MQLKDVEKQEVMRLMIAKFNRGDALTDDELKKLLAFYEQAAVMLDCLGPKFELALDRVRREFEVLDAFKENRKRHRKEDRKASRRSVSCPNCESDEGYPGLNPGSVECAQCEYEYTP